MQISNFICPSLHFVRLPVRLAFWPLACTNWLRHSLATMSQHALPCCFYGDMTEMPLSEKPLSQSVSQDERHQQGIQLFQERQFEEAARLIGEALLGTETSERWNDWATAVLSSALLA